MDFPLVSIILPTYNRAEWLPKSIGSVLEQTYKSWELIIWDDGSQDNTQEVVKMFLNKEPRIHYYQAKNNGKSYAVNQALQKADGEYIAFLDDDDQWYAEKLLLQVDIMKKHREIDLLFTNFYNINLATGKKGIYFDQTKSVIEKLGTKELSQEIFLITAGIPEQLLKTNFALPSSTILKRSCYLRTGDFNEQLRNIHDLEYWWRMGLQNCQFAYTTSILLNRNKPPNSLSSNNVLTYLDLLKALDFCYEEALQFGRKDLLLFFKPAYQSAWQQIIRLYALQGDRINAIKTFNKSISQGLCWRSIYLVIGAIIGPAFINMLRKRED
jgi:glycosyltransferase involved in cell wall biosynthesis